MELLVDLIPLAVAALNLTTALVNREKHAGPTPGTRGKTKAATCGPCDRCLPQSDAGQSAGPSRSTAPPDT